MQEVDVGMVESDDSYDSDPNIHIRQANVDGWAGLPALSQIVRVGSGGALSERGEHNH